MTTEETSATMEVEEKKTSKAIEDMTPREAVLDQSVIALKCAAYSKAPILTYADFRQGILEDRGLDVTQVAKDYGFQNGPDFLRDLGLKLNENGDLIVPSFEAAAVSSKFIAAKRVEEQKKAEKQQRYQNQQQQHYYTTQNRNPPPTAVVAAKAVTEADRVAPVQLRPANEVFIYDGDETKLKPGMRVKIATGVIHILPTLDTHGCDAATTHRLQIKAGQKYRKKVKEIVALDTKMRAVYAKMRGNKE